MVAILIPLTLTGIADVDPEAMKIYGINLDQVMHAVRGSNLDVGAQTI